MTSALLQNQIGILFFLGALLLIVVSNLWILKRLECYPHSMKAPRISVLVPARNEEDNIELCITSLLAQTYADFEVIALDDDSTDGTGAILARLAAEDNRLRVLHGSSLPAGWTGKNWACHQLAQQAEGQLLLFVDADTRHHPQMLQDAVNAQAAEDADLISAVPRQEVVSWAEKIVVPIIPWSMIAFIPLALAYRLRLPILSVAIGQFMLFRSAAYEEVGGHSAIRSAAVDDLALARRIKAAGLRWRLLDGTSRVECRMYRNTGEVVRGVSRTLFAVVGNRVLVHLFIWVWMTLAFLEPIGVLAMTAAGLYQSDLYVWMAGASVVTSLLIFVLVYQRFRLPRYLALAYPLTIAASVIIAFRSAYVNLTGRATWKGRQVGAAPK